MAVTPRPATTSATSSPCARTTRDGTRARPAPTANAHPAPPASPSWRPPQGRANFFWPRRPRSRACVWSRPRARPRERAPPVELAAADFEFRAGRGGDPSSWPTAPAPLSVTPLPAWRDSGAARYAITWADGAIRNTWLQVTVKANASTGLSRPARFTFGNLAGETGDAASPPRVSALDPDAVRRNLTRAGAGAAPAYDFNLDGRVNALDVAAVRSSLGRSLAAPTPAAPPAASTAVRPTAARRF